MYTYATAMLPDMSAAPQRPSRARPAAKRRARAAWGTISRERIVQAAKTIVAAGGYEQMTIRSLATELGASPMALYRHVRDKEDLLDEVVDRLLARRWRPKGDPTDWMGWTAESATRFHDFLVEQPAGLHVYLEHPVSSPVAMTRMHAIVDVLCAAGFDLETAQSVFGTLHTYTIGFAALEVSRTRARRDDLDDVARFLATFVSPDQFRQGLRYLLEGFGADLGRR